MNEVRFHLFFFPFFFVHKSECALFATREWKNHFFMRNGNKEEAKRIVMYGNGTLVMKIIIFYTKKSRQRKRLVVIHTYKYKRAIMKWNEWMSGWINGKRRRQNSNNKKNHIKCNCLIMHTRKLTNWLWMSLSLTPFFQESQNCRIFQANNHVQNTLFFAWGIHFI